MGLSHPSLALPLDAGRCDADVFMVTPLARQGIRLNQVLETGLPDTIESARWVAEVAEAIQHAHEHGLNRHHVHYSEIEIGHDRRAVLSEPARWLSWLDAPPEPYGNPACLAPEWIAGQAALGDPRSVVYSLGIVLYKVLTGDLPFQGGGIELVERILNFPPRSPRAIRRSIPKDVEAICLKAMARKPEDRYATPGELAQALRQFLSGQANRKQSFWKRE